MIKVLLVEKQRLFRRGIEALISAEQDMKVVGMAEDGNSALEQVATLNPDVVLIDIHMPNLSGIHTAARIKQQFSGVRVVFLTSEVEKELIIRAITIGDGFLLKDLYPDNLYQAIRDAYRGQVVLSGDVATILVNTIRELTMDSKNVLSIRLQNRGIHLTPRELDIAILLIEGKTNKQIAHTFHLSGGTVKNYISDLYMKLDIRNRNEVIKYLTGLIDGGVPR
ncbi:response regulator [Ornithinibacillus sp. L9]|uniref:Response regulator n=1 Tax=Ornithinibacillus caprae TaxID=2678566 RepID=A0A6N8FJ90_9BACI|nr:response regulator transcription factor [Ornithinibacillus caprae]MUK87408.1 response regulator [Ornithinibacillus caprae]